MTAELICKDCHSAYVPKKSFVALLKVLGVENISFVCPNTQLTCSKCKSTFVFTGFYKNLLANIGINKLPSTCPKCSLLHLEAIKKDDQSKLFLSEVITNREAWRSHCGMNRKQIESTFDNYDQSFDDGKHKKDWKICKDYAERFPFVYPSNYKSLFLFSSQAWGTGKTHLVSAIANRILDRWDGHSNKCPVHFISEPELFRRIRATYSYTDEDRKTKPSEAKIIARYLEIPLLIIDDLGKEQVKDPDFVQRTLFAIIDGRYQRKLPVIITSNVGPTTGLKEHLGADNENDASWDRLYEMCGGKWVNMEGNSYRRK